MKRLFAMALACMLALTAPVCACAEDAETDWYTLEEGNTAITVRLPGNTKFGLDWKCEISAPDGSSLYPQPAGKREVIRTSV